uniref:Uncharacterized protein n=1 Tax=Knipowitschia caucasica TaxID=637954 RepID=A0AAV2MS41_KNICA
MGRRKCCRRCCQAPSSSLDVIGALGQAHTYHIPGGVVHAALCEACLPGMLFKPSSYLQLDAIGSREEAKISLSMGRSMGGRGGFGKVKDL